MLRAMVFIDFENFDIAKFNYYKEKCLLEAQEEAKNNGTKAPRDCSHEALCFFFKRSDSLLTPYMIP